MPTDAADVLHLNQVIEAKTAKPIIGVEGEDARIDSRYANLAVQGGRILLTQTLQNAEGRPSQG